MTSLQVPSQVMGPLEGDPANRTDERASLLMRELVSLEQTVSLERLSALLADKLSLDIVHVEYVILQYAKGGERLAAVLADDVALLHV